MMMTLSELLELIPKNSKSYCPLTNYRFSSLRSIETAGYSERSSSGSLYFGDFSDIRDLDRYRGCTLILYSGKSVTLNTSDLLCNVILLFNSSEFDILIKKIFQKFEDQILLGEISENCLEIIKKNGDFQSLLDYSYSLLNNPIMLVDVTFNYVASSGTQNLDGETVWDFTIENGYMPNYYLEALFDHEKSVHDASDDALIMEEDTEKYLCHYQIAAKVTDKHMIAGYLKLLEVNRKITDFDKSVLILLSKFFSILEISNTKQEIVSVEDVFVQSVFEGKFKTREDLKEKKNALGIKFYDCLQIITVERKDRFTCKEDRTSFIFKKLKKLFEKHHVIMIDSYFVILYDTKEEDQGRRLSADTEFLSFLQEYECQANFSYRFSDLFDLPQYYRQTLFCISLRDLFAENRPTLFYEDIIEYHMLSCFSRITDLDFLIHPIVRKLQETDRKNGSNYLDTLFVYIKHSQDPTENGQCHVHTL